MTHPRTLKLAGLALAASALTACSGHEAPTEAPQVNAAGMALTVDVLADTDVARIGYTITGVDCVTGAPVEPPHVVEVIKDLEDLLLPGANPDLANQPFDAASGHLFADAFFWLPEGCYDVRTQPLTEAGEPSADCAAASQPAVPVFDGQTTEITLINQCENDPFGGLDVISALNHPPQIIDVTYDPSKFTCEDTTSICVTVTDPDNDPLRIDWDSRDEGLFVDWISEEINEEGALVACISVKLAGPGDYSLSFTAFDLAYDAEGNPTPIQALLGEGQTSNDAITLPIHAMSEEACVGVCECPEGFELSADGELCERVTTTDAVFNGEELTICRGSVNENYGAWGGLFPGGAVQPDPFFGQGFDANNGSRLNTAGIWACGPDGQSTTAPTYEWVGFSRCLDIEEGGAYVIGIAADNWMRAKLNGQTFFHVDANNESNDLHPYRHWHMIPVTLPAGVSIIELEGMNAGGPAAFAAEIYGPFDPASVQDDASLIGLDYANNIVWSTGDQVGGGFNTGVNSGWSCEDGYALDLCGGAPTCTLIERLACE